MVIDLPEAADLLVYSPFNTGETVAVEGLSIFSYYDPVRATDGAHALLSPLMKSVFIYGFGVSGGHVDVKKDFTLTATQRVGKKIATASAGEISASCASADNSVSTILRPAENLLTDNGVPIGIIEVAS
jgi:hypothetical protein